MKEVKREGGLIYYDNGEFVPITFLMTPEEYDAYCSFHETTNPIVLDFSKVRYVEEIHDILKKEFGLPDYYGMNWDALWDCLDYLFVAQGDILVQIKGFEKMTEEFQDYCRPMLQIFKEIPEHTPNVTFMFLP